MLGDLDRIVEYALSATEVAGNAIGLMGHFLKIFLRKLAGVALETLSPVGQIGKIAVPLLLIS